MSLSCLQTAAAAAATAPARTCSTISFSCCCCSDCCRTRWFCCTSAAMGEQRRGVKGGGVQTGVSTRPPEHLPSWICLNSSRLACSCCCSACTAAMGRCSPVLNGLGASCVSNRAGTGLITRWSRCPGRRGRSQSRTKMRSWCCAVSRLAAASQRIVVVRLLGKLHTPCQHCLACWAASSSRTGAVTPATHASLRSGRWTPA